MIEGCYAPLSVIVTGLTPFVCNLFEAPCVARDINDAVALLPIEVAGDFQLNKTQRHLLSGNVSAENRLPEIRDTVKRLKNVAI